MCLRPVRACTYFTLVFLALFSADTNAQRISPEVFQQIRALGQEKASWTPAQRKIDSGLLMSSKRAMNRSMAPGVPLLESRVVIGADGATRVDIKAEVTEDLLAVIEGLGGTVINSFPQYQAVRAFIPVEQLEALAAEIDVFFIQPAWDPLLNKDDTSEGDVTHRANVARSTFSVDGTGVQVGVLSDSVDALATLQASGDLPAVTVLPGQSGNPGSSEGTALLEIVFDLAPGADLFYATAFNGEASFAANIIALQEAGCDVIVDDVGYFAEFVFQDGIIAQAVETVTARGATYFSSAGNSGNESDGTSGVWEGDWSLSAGDPFGDGTLVHDFDDTPEVDTFLNTLTAASSSVYTLQWSDPAGASSNDYDLFLINSAGTAVTAASTNVQSGTQNPFEIIGASSSDTGRHLLVAKAAGAADRFLHMNSNRGRLSISTNGQIAGHAGAVSAFGVAAVDVADAGGTGSVFDGSESIETFSSDGPRRVFYTADGTPITAGNFSSTGGTVRAKPDITAGDGVSTATPGFSTFFGTSASAPHAAAIAALLIEQGVATTSAGIRTIMTGSALDIEATGIDNDSGAGIVDAVAALTLADAGVRITPLLNLESTGPEGGSFSPTNKTYTITNNSSSSVNWTASASETWVSLSSSGGSIASSGSTTVTVSVNSNANSLAVGDHSALVTFTHDGSVIDQVRLVTLTVRGLDHFVWNAISTTQTVNSPIGVTVTAQDSGNQTLTTFTDKVSLSGVIGFGTAPSIVITEMNPASPDNVEFMNVSGSSIDISNWVITIYDTITWPSPVAIFTIPSSTAAVASAIFTIQEFGTAPGTYPAFFTGANIDWTNGSTSVGVLLQDNFGNIVDFATTGTSTEITSPVTIPSAQWSGLGISTTRGNRSYQRTGSSDNNVNSDWFDANNTFGSINSGLTVPFPSPITTVGITPTMSGSFVNGVWTGNVTVTEAATGMHLDADDGIGHTGASNTFNAVTSTLTTVDAHTNPQANRALPEWNTSEIDKMSVLKFRISDHGADALPTLVDQILINISGTAGQAANDIAWAELHDGTARVSLSASISNTQIVFGSTANSDSAAQFDTIANNGQVEYTVFIFLNTAILAAHDATYIFDVDETDVGVDGGSSSQMAGDSGGVTPVVGTIFITALGITVMPGTWSIGPQALDAVVETGPFTVENNGNVAEDFDIVATNGANSWNLAASPGANAFKVEADQGDNGSYETILTVVDQIFATNVSVLGAQSLGLRYTAPTSDTQGEGVSHGFTVTLTASRHVP